MKKNRVRVCAAIVIAVLSGACAFSGDWSLSAAPITGMRFGSMDEYVFMTDTKLSELNFTMVPAWYAGGKLDVGWKDLHLNSSLRGFFPGKCGELCDSDWMNLTDVKTNYSVSNNCLDTGLSTEVQLYYTFRPALWISLAPAVGFEYEYFNFLGRDGTAWYGNLNKATGEYSPYNSSDRTVTDLSGYDVIRYTRWSCGAWIGGTAAISSGNRWSFSLGGFVSPFMYIDAVDHHLLRMIYLYARMPSWFGAYKMTTSASCAVSDRFRMSISITGFIQPVVRSDYYQSLLKYNNYQDLAALYPASKPQLGARAEYLEATISATYLFF